MAYPSTLKLRVRMETCFDPHPRFVFYDHRDQYTQQHFYISYHLHPLFRYDLRYWPDRL